MSFRDYNVHNNGDNCIITTYKEVFEEVPEQGKDHMKEQYNEYDEEPMCKCTKKRRRMFEIDKVVGMGSGETFVDICIPLCPPAVEVLSCIAAEDVKFDVLAAKKGKVFINGRLFKNIPYRTRQGFLHKDPCCGTDFICGTKCAVAEVPFMLCINVPGAVEGNKVVVLDYEINAVNIPNYGCRCLIRSITEKDCISVKVKVVKPQIIHIPKEE